MNPKTKPKQKTTKQKTPTTKETHTLKKNLTFKKLMTCVNVGDVGLKKKVHSVYSLQTNHKTKHQES